MDIQFQKKEGLLATLTIKLQENDYQLPVENEMKKIQKTVSLKGFRPGKAPMGIVKNMYGKGVLVQEINKLTNKALMDYLKENNIDILAQPLESTESESKMDFDNPKDFELAFDLGLAPEIDLNISSDDTLTKYKILLTDKDINEEIEQLRNRYGSMEEAEVVSDKDIVYAEVTELNDDGTPLEEGVAQKSISFTAEMIEDEELKNRIIGLKKGDSLLLNVKTLFKNNESVISNTLGIPKEAVLDLSDQFTCQITDIKTRVPAELNEAFFKMVSGDENIVNEEDFKAKVIENIQTYYEDESDQLLEFELENLIDKKHNVELPDTFLKRWLTENKEKEYDESNIEERYEQEAFALKRTLIREKFAKTHQIEINADEINDTAIAYTFGLFRNYGIPNPEMTMVQQYAANQLKEESFVNKMGDIALKRKVIFKLKEIVSLEIKEISKEDFYKKVNEEKHQAHSHSHSH